jgi:hypothetical protein
MSVGYKKPPKKTQFKPGQSGNPGGVSSERKRLLNESAEMAARIMHRQLEALEGMFAEHPEKERIVGSINADIHRLVKDAIDRAEGTARQSVDMTSSDGSMTPKGIPEDVITALDAIAGKITGGDSTG